MSAPLDANAHDPLHGGPSFSLANRVERAVFSIFWRLLAWILPPPFGWAWRRQLLRIFGATMGQGAKVYPSTRIWLPRHLRMGAWSSIGPGAICYNQAHVTICESAIVSQRAFLCAGDHDHRASSHQLITSPITIGADAWVAAEAFVGPGITIGPGAILGARGCAVKDIPANAIWAGNPATHVAERDSPD